MECPSDLTTIAYFGITACGEQQFFCLQRKNPPLLPDLEPESALLSVTPPFADLCPSAPYTPAFFALERQKVCKLSRRVCDRKHTVIAFGFLPHATFFKPLDRIRGLKASEGAA